jgi:hypothetical protein
MWGDELKRKLGLIVVQQLDQYRILISDVYSSSSLLSHEQKLLLSASE